LGSSNKLSSKSQTSTGAISIYLLGNQWEQIADEVTDTTKIFFEVQLKYNLIAYGYDNKWVFKTVRNSFTCSTSYFGEDPYSGKVKGCYRLKDYSGFKDCATEGATCKMSETGYKLVRYGYDDNYNYNYKTINTKSVKCSNSTFGDPMIGITLLKKCSYVVTGA